MDSGIVGTASGGAAGASSNGGTGASSGGKRNESTGGSKANIDAGEDARRGESDAAATDTGSDAPHESPDAASQSPDATADGGFATCIQVSDGGAAWPDTIPSSTSAACVPNCGVDTCAGTCTLVEPNTGESDWDTPLVLHGGPCDTGCCSNLDIHAFFASTTPSRAWLFASVTDSSGTTYALSTNGGVYYSEAPATGSGTAVANLDCANIESDPVSHNEFCSDSLQGDPLIAVGGPANGRVIYVIYDPIANNPPGGGIVTTRPPLRFGTKAGGVWTFEDLALYPSGFAADPAGAAYITSGGKLYRHEANVGGWKLVPTPCSSVLSSFAADDSGALYFATQKNQIWRRDSSREWSMEVTPGPVDRVYFGAGTVHYTGQSTASVGGQTAPSLHYGRRRKATWIDLVASQDFLDGYSMALDACGAPHFGLIKDDVTPLGTPVPSVYYERWTAMGWRSSNVRTYQDPIGIAATAGKTDAQLDFAGGAIDLPFH
jgi:hypothetical protein